MVLTLWYALYLLRSKHIVYFLHSRYKLQSKRLVTVLVSLHTQTRLHNLTIQVLITRVCFIDIWYSSLTSIHYNFKLGLVIITKRFSPLNLNYTTSFVKAQIRSDVPSHAIPDTVYLPWLFFSKLRILGDIHKMCISGKISAFHKSTKDILEHLLF